MSCEPNPHELSVKIEFLLDSFGVPDTDEAGDDSDPVGGTLGVQADVFHDWFEFSRDVEMSSPKLIAFRIRTHGQIVGSRIWASLDGGDYVFIGSQNVSAAGGPTRNNLGGAAGPEIVESGPIVDFYTE